MDSAGFLRKLQDIYTKHKIIFSIFLILFVLPISGFYSFYSTKYLSDVFLTNPSNSEDANILIATTFHYIKFVLEVEAFAVLGISMFFLLTPLLHILESEKIDPALELSFKSLILIVTKPAKSLLVTWFIVRLLKLGYIFIGMLLFHQQLMLNSSGHEQSQLCALPGSGTSLLVAVAVFLYAYLAIFWNLALEISLREEKSGIEAIGKASQLIEGRRKLIGFVINLVLGVLSLVLFVGYEYLKRCAKLSEASKGSIMLNISSYMIWFEFYTWASFSILYFSCKKTRGEAIHLQGSLKHIMQQQPLISGNPQIV